MLPLAYYWLTKLLHKLLNRKFLFHFSNIVFHKKHASSLSFFSYFYKDYLLALAKMVPGKNPNIFFKLLRAGLWEEDVVLPQVSDDEWSEVLSLAEAQTVVGIIARGVDHSDSKPPQDVILKLVSKSYEIERRSTKVEKGSEALMQYFESKGLRPILQKGPAIAKYYANPLSRTSGDIDLYFSEKDFDKAEELARKNEKNVEREPDGSVTYSVQGIPVEHHPRFFDLHCKESKLPEISSPEGTLLMLSAHILKHCMGAGVGLRQICDMAVAYKALYGQYDQKKLADIYKSVGLGKWNQLLDSFLFTYLGLDPDYFTTSKLTSPDPLVKIVLRGGNFGRGVSFRKNTLNSGKLVRKFGTVAVFLRSIPFSLKYGTREFLPSIAELVRGNL